MLGCNITNKKLYSWEHSDDSDEDSSISDSEVMTDTGTDEINGSFIFKPRTLGTLFSSGGSTNRTAKIFCNNTLETLNSLNGLSEESDSLSSNGCMPRETASANGFSSVSHSTNSYSDLQSPRSNFDNHDSCSTETMNRREECLDDNGCNLDSRTQGTRSSNHHAMRCSGDTSMSVSTTHKHEKGPNFRSTSNGSSEAKSTSNGITGEKSTSNRITGERSASNGITDEKKMKSVPKILLVEDNKINVMVAQSMMKQLGHSIDIANNGLEAIRAVQRFQYDLVLMDVCMPVMDGLHATRLIRSYEQHGYWDNSIAGNRADDATAYSDSQQRVSDEGRCRKRIPIVAMTANALSESAEDCLANGMDSFVSKPVTFQKLKQCLEQYLPY